MTQSLYLVGGAGSGKSTFMQWLLADAGLHCGEFEVLHKGQTGMGLVPLGGHRLPGDGVYLGRMREHFPGTDALNRAASPVGVAWLHQGDLPAFIVGEGITLGTRPFLAALANATDLLVVHTVAEPFVKELWAAGREAQVAASGMVFHDRPTIKQKDTFVTGTATRAANLARDLRKAEVDVLDVDTADPAALRQALLEAGDHLWG
jgi:hypothetical protein